MVFEKGDLVKLDVGVHIKGALGDNAITLEVGNAGNHTDQIKAAKDARDAAVEKMHPGTSWHVVGAAAEQVAKDAGFLPISNLCGHKWKDGACMMGFEFLCTLVGPIIQVSKAQ